MDYISGIYICRCLYLQWELNLANHCNGRILNADIFNFEKITSNIMELFADFVSSKCCYPFLHDIRHICEIQLLPNNYGKEAGVNP